MYIEEVEHQKRHELIEEYQSILKINSIQFPKRAEILFRLAEQEFKAGRYYYFTEMEIFQEEYDHCFNTQECIIEQLKPNNNESQKWKRLAIQHYREILQQHPHYSRIDEVVFYLASALEEFQKPREALKLFQRLTKDYKRSSYLPEAYLKIGEYYFDQNHAKKALVAYKKTTELKSPNLHVYAMYKLAWCYYNIQDYNQAIASMKQVVDHIQLQIQSGDGNKSMIMQDEAFKDLVLFYIEADERDLARTYFSSQGREEFIELMNNY